MLIIGVVADFVQVAKALSHLAVEIVCYINEGGGGSMSSSDWKATGSSKLRFSQQTLTPQYRNVCE